MKSILVTGGAGYIGSHTCVCLLEKGYDVKAFTYYNRALDSQIDYICFHAYYNLAKYFYLTNNIVVEKDIKKAKELAREV